MLTEHPDINKTISSLTTELLAAMSPSSRRDVEVGLLIERGLAKLVQEVLKVAKQPPAGTH